MSKIVGGANKCLFDTMAYASEKFGCDNSTDYYVDQYRHSDIAKNAPGNSAENDIKSGFENDNSRMKDYLKSQFDFDDSSKDLAGICDTILGGSSLIFATVPGPSGYHCVALTGFSKAGSSPKSLYFEYYDATDGSTKQIGSSKINYIGEVKSCY